MLRQRKPMTRRKLFFIIGGVLLVIIAGIMTVFILLNQKTNTNNPPAKEIKKEVIKYYSPLTGSLVNDEATTKIPITGVMIENSPDARPQSGLKNSGVVFEAIAEGGITRFLVLYQEQKPQLIGPVRSVRPYYIDWATAFDASIAHIGGSDDALEELRNGSHRDLDQFFNAGAYWRSDDRYAPHNVYTSFENLDTLNAEKGYATSDFTGFSRVDGKASTESNAIQFDITISSYLYNSSYTYDSATNTYLRSQAGEAHVDREEGQITPSVVIAMFVEEYNTGDYKNHEQITTIGSGRAIIFQNGLAIEAVWNKSSQTSQISFTDSEGNDIALVRGQTWITAIPNNGEGNATWQAPEPEPEAN